MNLDHLLPMYVSQIMLILSAVIENLMACTTLMVLFNGTLKKWQELGHEKLHQWLAAVVRLVHVERQFSNVVIFSTHDAG